MQSDQRLSYSLSEKYHIKTCYKRNVTVLVNLCSSAGWFVYDLVRNPEDSYFCIMAKIMTQRICDKNNSLIGMYLWMYI